MQQQPQQRSSFFQPQLLQVPQPQKQNRKRTSHLNQLFTSNIRFSKRISQLDFSRTVGSMNKLRKAPSSLKSTLSGMPSGGGLNKSRLRNIQSIQDNIQTLFKQHIHKWQALLTIGGSSDNGNNNAIYSNKDCNNSQKQLQHHQVNSSKVHAPEVFSPIKDGVYVLIQGNVKVITFDEENPPYRSVVGEVVKNVFCKLRINRELAGSGAGSGTATGAEFGSKKVTTGGMQAGLSQANSHSTTPNHHHTNSNSNHNRMLSSNSVSCPQPQAAMNPGQDPLSSVSPQHTVTSICQPFSIFQSINENCMCFSSDTILYQLQENDLRIYRFKQNKQRIRTFLQSNNHLIKNHSMLHHTTQSKIYSFRNILQVENVAIIMRGSVNVVLKDIGKGKRKGKGKGKGKERGMAKQIGLMHQQINMMTRDSNGQYINSFFNNSSGISNSNNNNNNAATVSTMAMDKAFYKNRICELGPGSLLIKGFFYEVISADTELLCIQQNQTFEFIKYPEWVLEYDQRDMDVELNRSSVKTNNNNNINTNNNKTNEQSQIALRSLSNSAKTSLHVSPNSHQQHKLKQRNLTKHHHKNHSLTHEYDSINIDDDDHNTSDINFKENLLMSDQKTQQRRYHYNQLIKKKHSNPQENIQAVTNAIVNAQKERSSNANTMLFNCQTAKSKEKLFFKAMAPYIIISQKVGAKEMIQTMKMLKQKEQAAQKNNQQGKAKFKKLSSKIKLLKAKFPELRNCGDKDDDNDPAQNPLRMMLPAGNVGNFRRMKGYLSLHNQQSMQMQRQQRERQSCKTGVSSAWHQRRNRADKERSQDKSQQQKSESNQKSHSYSQTHSKNQLLQNSKTLKQLDLINLPPPYQSPYPFSNKSSKTTIMSCHLSPTPNTLPACGGKKESKNPKRNVLMMIQNSQNTKIINQQASVHHNNDDDLNDQQNNKKIKRKTQQNQQQQHRRKKQNI